jgi:2-keto-4-pentenoate hydratase
LSYWQKLEIGLTQTSELTLAKQLATRYLNKKTVDDLDANLTLDEAQAIQEKFVQFISAELGKPIGYKAGLTNRKIQDQFKVTHPVLGVLLEKMILKSGTIVPTNFGARPSLEGDLIVRVGSEAINDAKTPQEILAALDAVIPFLELPDLVYARTVKLTAPKLVAINVGARLGIAGEPIPLKATDNWQKQLGKIKLVIVDQTGHQLAAGESSVLLGNPLKVVMGLRDTLKTQGKTLKKGDLLSLGSITPLIPIPPGMTVYGRYSGFLDNNPVEISVHFQGQ